MIGQYSGGWGLQIPEHRELLPATDLETLRMGARRRQGWSYALTPQSWRLSILLEDGWVEVGGRGGSKTQIGE